MFTFSIRDLFWLVFVAAVFTLWGMDHTRQAAQIDVLTKPKPAPASPYYQFEGGQYFPPGPEFPLPNEAAAPKAYQAVDEAPNPRVTTGTLTQSHGGDGEIHDTLGPTIGDVPKVTGQTP